MTLTSVAKESLDAVRTRIASTPKALTSAVAREASSDTPRPDVYKFLECVPTAQFATETPSASTLVATDTGRVVVNLFRTRFEVTRRSI